MSMTTRSAIRRITGAARLAAVVFLLLTIASACAPPGQDKVYWPTEEWRTSTPEKEDMDSARLQQMMDLIDEQGFDYHSVLVVRHGAIVWEEYLDDWRADMRHHLQSTTKSFSSMLIGIAIQQGYVEGVDEKMVDLFSSYTIENLDARKERITLEHLLTMSDGMDWHEIDYAYTDPRNTLGQMWRHSDAVKHVLNRPMAREPGETWAYNSGTSILLGGVLEEATGRDVLAFARETLFDPLGIGTVLWDRTTGGNHYHTDGGLYLTPRDMARFGYLMLHGGTWDGQEIVSPEWVARSTETHYPVGSGLGYGYQWWTMEGGIFAAQGHYEQKIFVVPQADMVVVFTGDIPDDVLAPTNGLVYSHILAACTDLPSEATHRTYDKHGFSFEYPAGFSVAEMPFPGQDAVSAEAGMVQFRSDSYPFELIQAMWVQAEPGVDPEVYLAEFAQTASQQDGVEYTTSEPRSGMKGEHQAVYHSFDFEQQGLQLKGMTTAWACAESERTYIFSYATNPQVSDQDLELRFQEHLDAFACHGAGAGN